jgi:hypothetical protein
VVPDVPSLDGGVALSPDAEASLDGLLAVVSEPAAASLESAADESEGCDAVDESPDDASVLAAGSDAVDDATAEESD